MQTVRGGPPTALPTALTAAGRLLRLSHAPHKGRGWRKKWHVAVLACSTAVVPARLPACLPAGTCAQQCGAAAACNPLCVGAVRRLGPRRSPAVLQQQHLFSVYVHARPTLKDYKEPSIFAGRLIPDRAVGAAALAVCLQPPAHSARMLPSPLAASRQPPCCSQGAHACLTSLPCRRLPCSHRRSPSPARTRPRLQPSACWRQRCWTRATPGSSSLTMPQVGGQPGACWPPRGRAPLQRPLSALVWIGGFRRSPNSPCHVALRRLPSRSAAVPPHALLQPADERGAQPHRRLPPQGATRVACVLVWSSGDLHPVQGC